MRTCHAKPLLHRHVGRRESPVCRQSFRERLSSQIGTFINRVWETGINLDIIYGRIVLYSPFQFHVIQSQNMEGFILLKDVTGEERGGLFYTATNFFAEGKTTKQRNIARGELLCPIHDNTPQKGGKPPPNYRLAGDRNVTLFAEEQAVSPLTPKEFDILEGIKLPYDRYRVFTTEGWLEWGVSLRVGSTASVAIEGIGGAPVTTEVAVCYIGRIFYEPGVKFGVEIKVRLVML